MKKLLNLVIPASGGGTRFKNEGYLDSKPAIMVGGRRMIEWPLSNFKAIEKDINLCLIVQKSDNEKYDFKSIVEKSFNFAKVNIVELEGVTDGALTSVMKAEEYFVDGPICVCNSDHFAEDFDVVGFMLAAAEKDGAIITFTDDNPKWSFVEIDEKNIIKRVAEKRVISNTATLGIYLFKCWEEFANYAEAMDYWNIRHMGELYVAPIINEYCRDGKRIVAVNHPKDKTWGLGVPSDLEIFKKNYLKENV